MNTDIPVVKEVSSVLRTLYGSRLSKIILYGSFARGEQREDSDIDFLVVLKDVAVSPYREIDFYGDVVSGLSEKYNREISVKATDARFLEDTGNLLARIVREEGIAIS